MLRIHHHCWQLVSVLLCGIPIHHRRCLVQGFAFSQTNEGNAFERARFDARQRGSLLALRVSADNDMDSFIDDSLNETKNLADLALNKEEEAPEMIIDGYVESTESLDSKLSRQHNKDSIPVESEEMKRLMKIKSESSNPFERLQADFQIKRIQTMGQKRKEDGKWDENVKRFKEHIYAAIDTLKKPSDVVSDATSTTKEFKAPTSEVVQGIPDTERKVKEIQDIPSETQQTLIGVKESVTNTQHIANEKKVIDDLSSSTHSNGTKKTEQSTSMSSTSSASTPLSVNSTTSKRATETLKATSEAFMSFTKITGDIGAIIAKGASEAIEASNKRKAEQKLQKINALKSDVARAERLASSSPPKSLSSNADILKELEDIDLDLSREVAAALEAAQQVLDNKVENEKSDNNEAIDRSILEKESLDDSYNDESIVEELAAINLELSLEVEAALKIAREALSKDDLDSVKKALEQTEKVAELLRSLDKQFSNNDSS